MTMEREIIMMEFNQGVPTFIGIRNLQGLYNIIINSVADVF